MLSVCGASKLKLSQERLLYQGKVRTVKSSTSQPQVKPVYLPSKDWQQSEPVNQTKSEGSLFS